MSWISRSQIEELHSYLLNEHGGLAGIRDAGLLESAISTPLASFGGKYLYPSIVESAARLGFGLVSNHPFNDGNKRVGVMAMLVVLESNGYAISASNDEVIALGLGLADGTLSYDDTLEWVNRHTKD